jgi:hypothetical protein
MTWIAVVGDRDEDKLGANGQGPLHPLLIELVAAATEHFRAGAAQIPG